MNVRVGVGTKVPADGSRGQGHGRRRRGWGEWRGRVTLPLGREGEYGGSRRECPIQEFTERSADGGERSDVRGVRVGKTVATANDVGEEL